MKTRILVERLIGENEPTYFLDFFDTGRMEWKNHSSHETLDEAELEQKHLVESNVVKAA